MTGIHKTVYSHRIITRVVIEAVTPLAVGSGNMSVFSDSLVATDVNSLPYIPATAIAGVMRGMMGSEHLKRIFGYQDYDGGRGSELIFTEAKILDHIGLPVDGLNPSAIKSDPLLRKYQELPVRQHVRITSSGVAADRGKFDEQVVYAGTRFCFEMEMVSEGNNIPLLESVLTSLYSGNFRIGGGTRSGFGEIKVVDMKIARLDLRNGADRRHYLSKSSSLDSGFWSNPAVKFVGLGSTSSDTSGYVTRLLTLNPDSFFLFGSGFGDDDADITPVKAAKVIWHEKNGKLEGRLVEGLTLIPASSVKGALSHRVAFHFNRLNGIFADKLDEADFKAVSGKVNPAVRVLFGSEGRDGMEMTRGNVIFSDVICSGGLPDKILNHVAIDRFTGGGLEGALFTEKVTYGAGNSFTTTLSIDMARLEKACEKTDPRSPEKLRDIALKSLDEALKDICGGMLPLGGGVNRGHGVFKGFYK